MKSLSASSRARRAEGGLLLEQPVEQAAAAASLADDQDRFQSFPGAGQPYELRGATQRHGSLNVPGPQSWWLTPRDLAEQRRGR